MMIDLSPDELEFRRYEAEFESYVNVLRREWLAGNRPYIKNVAPVAMTNNREREKIEATQSKWGTYITPISEAWWLERGYEVIWPLNNEEAVKYCKIEDSQ